MDQISDFFASEAHNSLLSFWAKLGYSQIEIDHIAVSLLKLQIKIGVHLINVELLQLLTPNSTYGLTVLQYISTVLYTFIRKSNANWRKDS